MEREYAPGVPDRLSQCQFYLPGKRRFCKFDIHASSTRFCGFHQESDERVPCPLDTNHTVLRIELTRHLLKCPAREPDVMPEWYNLNHNVSLSDFVANDTSHILQDCTIADIEDMAALAMNATAKLHIETDVKQHHVMTDRINGAMKLKHAQQQSSLIGHLFESGFLQGVDLYIEWGAGRAELSGYMSRAVEPDQDRSGNFLLIDRESPRLKFDSRITSWWHERLGSGAAVAVSRVKADIAHLQIDKLVETEFPQLERPRICSVSKHLCGAATDLTITSLTESHFREAGLLIALCCHQLCTWHALTDSSRAFLTRLGCVKPRQFDILKHMTSWHTSGLRPGMKSEAIGNHRTSYTHQQRDSIGQACKRVIDLARVAALENNGWSASLIKYQSEEITTECFALLASKR